MIANKQKHTEAPTRKLICMFSLHKGTLEWFGFDISKLNPTLKRKRFFKLLFLYIFCAPSRACSLKELNVNFLENLNYPNQRHTETCKNRTTLRVTPTDAWQRAHAPTKDTQNQFSTRCLSVSSSTIASSLSSKSPFHITAELGEPRGGPLFPSTRFSS